MKKVRNISWVVFFLSTFLFCGYLPFLERPNLPETGESPGIMGTPQLEVPNPPLLPPNEASDGNADSAQMVVLITTLLGSISSFFVGIVTSVLSYRRGKVEITKSELELEKMRIEILELKRKALGGDEEKAGK